VTLDFDATDAVVQGQQQEAAFGHRNARAGRSGDRAGQRRERGIESM